MIPAADRGTEKNQGLVDSLLLEGQHTSGSKDIEPKINRAEGYTLGEGLPSIPPKLIAKIKQGNFVQMHELLPDY